MEIQEHGNEGLSFRKLGNEHEVTIPHKQPQPCVTSNFCVNSHPEDMDMVLAITVLFGVRLCLRTSAAISSHEGLVTFVY